MNSVKKGKRMQNSEEVKKFNRLSMSPFRTLICNDCCVTPSFVCVIHSDADRQWPKLVRTWPK